MRCSFGRILLAAALICILSNAALADTIADSVDDWSFDGVQGENNWFNGYYNLTLDQEVGDGTYQPDDFIPFLNDESLEVWEDGLNHWDGGGWRLYRDRGAEGLADTGPWTSINQNDGHPNGTNSLPPTLVDDSRREEHWPIRRWVSTYDGEVSVISSLAATNTNCGNGTSVEVFHNGVPINGSKLTTNQAGTIMSTVGAVLAMDDVLEIALTPDGPDGCDGSAWRMTITDDEPPPPPPPPRTKLADSVADWSATGTQGEKNWFNGYYNYTDDADGVYQTTDFMQFTNDAGPAGGPVEPDGNHWTGTQWDLDSQGDPGPWTELGQTTTHPNGTNSAPNAEHWTIRRYVASDLAGATALELNWQMAKANTNGDGVTGILMVNGEQVDAATIAGGDGNGVNRSFYVNANPNDIIELALSPVGLTNDGDGADGSRNQLSIYSELPDGPLFNPGGVIADSIAEFSGEQGRDGWFYGLYDQRIDAEDGDGVYSVDEFERFLNDGSDFITDDPFAWRDENHWNGNSWDIVDQGVMDPQTGPWTALDANGGHPAANAQGNPEVHWSIRRWVSDVEGEYGIRGTLNNTSANGDGTVGRILLDGEEIWSAVTDGTSEAVDVVVSLSVDSVLDFVIDPDGAGNYDPGDPLATIDSVNDGSDYTVFNFQISELIPFIPVGGGIEGDYNNDGKLDALDIDLQAAEMKKPAAEQDLAKFDHNNDGVINVGEAGPDQSKWGDRIIWVRELRGTAIGDSNFDDVFDSGDLVLVFGKSKYDSGEMATWEEGDWSGDMIFDSGDLVLAFQDGQYVAAATPAVPEPSSLTLLAMAGLWLVRRRRRHA